MSKKVLIVEDYADSRSFMRFIVEDCGYQVIEASNGIDAIKMAQNEKPDLILMDLGMPGIDGLSATRVIRELVEEAVLPIIAVTAYGVDNGQARAAGCNELLFKPLEAKSLELILGKYLAS